MIIGLSQRVLLHKNRAYDAFEQGWYSYLKDHTLLVIPNRLDQDFDELSNTLDALILTGGDDSTLRRNVELKIASAMLEKQKPIVGVCHGCFLLTDVLGGQVEEVIGHVDTSHTVNYFGDAMVVNSYHSLGIKSLHKSGTVLATDPEGNCESWIDENIAGIVWHPERMAMPWIPDEIQDLLDK
jgi:gamma-glutamyl-gamma-aminobutyrate hydrolase PuuD